MSKTQSTLTTPLTRADKDHSFMHVSMRSRELLQFQAHTSHGGSSLAPIFDS